MSEMSLKDIAMAAANNDGELSKSQLEDLNRAQANDPLAPSEDDFIIGKPKPKEEPKSDNDGEKTVNTIPQAVAVPVADSIDLNPTAPTDEQKFQMMWKAKLPEERRALAMMGMSPTDIEISLQKRFEAELEKIRSGKTEEDEPVQEEASSDPETNDQDSAKIIIDKTSDVNDLGLTAEEHEKLSKVRSIRLIAVEDAELKHITVRKMESDHKVDFIKSIESTLSRYSVPLPILGDFVPFKGAQIVQLVNAIDYQDESVSEQIAKRASFIYEKLMNGKLLKKYDDEGKVIMSYQEFINTYPYQDIDMGLLGILCASSPEESTASMTCAKCNHTYDQKYNVKTLLQTDGLNDVIKQRFEDVLANKSSAEKLMAMMNLTRDVKRYKSPFSGNIYDMNPPSIGRAISILEQVDQEDQVALYISAMALYLNRILIPTQTEGEYVEVTEDEPALLLDTVKELPEDDTQMLLRQIQDTMTYTPQFGIHTKCPKCGNKTTVPVAIRELVFLRAQDSLMEIQ